MGSSSCGVVIKKVLAETELEQVFGKELIKIKGESWFDYLNQIIDDEQIAVVVGSQGTAVFHDMYSLDDYTSSFKDELKKSGGCGFAMSTTSMSASFVHYLLDGIQHDGYLYEAEFTQEGPNILGITENMEMLFENVDELIQKYIGPYDTWSDASFYKLGDSLPKEVDEELKETVEKLDLDKKSSGDLLELAVSGISVAVNIKEDLGKFSEMMKVYAGVGLKVLQSRGARLNGLYPKVSKEYLAIKNKYEKLTISELRGIRIKMQQVILSGERHFDGVSHYYIAKEVIADKIAYLRKEKRLEERAESMVEKFDDRSIEELTFTYVYLCSSFENQELKGYQLELVKKAVELQFRKRNFKYIKSVNEKETYEYFESFFKTLRDKNLHVQDYSFSTLGMTKQLVQNYSKYSVLRALKAEFIARNLKPAENSLIHHLLFPKKANPSVESSNDSSWKKWMYISGAIIIGLIIVGKLNKPKRTQITPYSYEAEEPSFFDAQDLISFYRKTDTTKIKYLADNFDFIFTNEREQIRMGNCWVLYSEKSSQVIYINETGQILFEPGKYIRQCVEMIEKTCEFIGNEQRNGISVAVYRRAGGFEYGIENMNTREAVIYIF